MAKTNEHYVSEHVKVRDVDSVSTHTTHEVHESHSPRFNRARFDYDRRNRTAEMRQQVTTFAVMIFLTFIAFAMVAAGLDKAIVLPILILLAFIQVILQFFYFMHMKHEGHGVAKIFMLSGIFLALSFMVTALYLVWLGDPLK
ncbi:cytochrome B6 [Macrococcus brunensis]|uniref:Cytochrome B6 n=1 Tax=Macrococcus brunensis TaxID=198483 RepID=A0A4R6BG50_9STAP|nr:cytochrome C oxidase subunit IV family protein [Macrococcus brunensis]TDL98800.1 cytochrome B6 [Macrococcus brunensis]